MPAAAPQSRYSSKFVGVPVGVGKMGVSVGGGAGVLVAVAGGGVSVGGAGVSVGGTGVSVGGAGVTVGAGVSVGDAVLAGVSVGATMPLQVTVMSVVFVVIHEPSAPASEEPNAGSSATSSRRMVNVPSCRQRRLNRVTWPMNVVPA